MAKKTIKELAKGEFFRLTDSETAPVWVRSDYDRSSKKYSCYKFDDVCHENFFKGTKVVFVDFEF